MSRTTRSPLRHLSAPVLAVLTALWAAPALAQPAASVDEPLFLDVNVGFAATPSAFTSGTQFSLFGEQGSSATAVQPGALAMFDVRLGYRVTRSFGVAGALSGGQSDAAGSTMASVPSPIRFASPTVVSLASDGLKRRELGYHLQAVYVRPLADRATLSLSGGPSLFQLQQGVPSVVLNGSAPATAAANEHGTGVGVNVGADFATLFSSHYGAGVFVRYAAGTVNLPSVSDLKIGGLQVGAGLRIRY